MQNVELFYQLTVGNGPIVTFDSGIRPGHSFTKQFLQLWFNLYAGGWAVPVAITDTSAASVTTYTNMRRGFRTDAGTTTSTYGIQVGTSTGAESISDAALGTQIAHGTSAGQLQYGSMTYGAPSTTATTTTFRFTRVFTNGSGGTVTVQEIGLVGQSITGKRFLFIRDLTGAVPINNGQQLTVNYDLTTTI